MTVSIKFMRSLEGEYFDLLDKNNLENRNDAF